MALPSAPLPEYTPWERRTVGGTSQPAGLCDDSSQESRGICVSSGEQSEARDASTESFCLGGVALNWTRSKTQTVDSVFRVCLLKQYLFI